MLIESYISFNDDQQSAYLPLLVYIHSSWGFDLLKYECDVSCEWLRHKVLAYRNPKFQFSFS